MSDKELEDFLKGGAIREAILLNLEIEFRRAQEDQSYLNRDGGI